MGGQGRPPRAGASDTVLRAERKFSRPVVPESPEECFKKVQIPEPHTRPTESKALGMVLWNCYSLKKNKKDYL